jgi:UDP-2,3-diacylglucosamine pyrophosphatase LpxH
MGYWSLAAAAKHKVKKAASHIANFERALAYEARREAVDGLICGHIHRPELRPLGGAIYVNCGDWVESLTALVEHYDGTLELWRLGGQLQLLRRLEPVARDAAA